VCDYCFCATEQSVEKLKNTRDYALSGRVFKYQMVYGSYPGFAFKGMSNAQTLTVIRKAMAALSNVSGAKFTEVTKSPNLRFYFMKEVQYNAIGVYMGNGKVYLSQTRPITEPIANICVQHEVGHFLGVKASPASDKWGHCPTATCIMNINGTGPTWCPRCRAQLTSKYGK
jgi:hypothetical protein